MTGHSVTLGGQPYLFVNPKFAGRYLPPDSNQWFNYGGDKLWLLPEGNDDEQHWPGNSDVLDDGPFCDSGRAALSLCESQVRGQVPAARFESVVQLRRGQALALARRK